MQAQMQEAQAEIGQMQVQGESGAGLVKVTMNGRHEVSRVEIDPSLLSEKKSVLEDLLAAACNDTVRVEKAQAEKMQELGGGMLAGLNLLWQDAFLMALGSNNLIEALSAPRSPA